MSRGPAQRVLLAGGGSGGHVFPALAIGDELAQRGWLVDFSGVAGGMEERLVGEHGLAFHPLAARPLVGRGVADRLRALWTLAGSTAAARRLVRQLGVAVVVGTGGYVSAPAVLGGALAGVPALLVEPNAAPGAANRWLSRWAVEAAIAFPAAAGGLRCPSTLTGVPVRSEFAALPEVVLEGAARSLLVAGGSQGAEQLNRLVPEALGRLVDGGSSSVTELTVLHQAGAGKSESTAEAYSAAGLEVSAADAMAADGGGPLVRVVDFLADMPAAIGAAQLVVSRGGAITTAELLSAGRPAILVPLTLAGGHQLDNARAVEAAGAAIVLPSAGLDAAALAAVLDGVLGDRARLAAMARSARVAGKPRAAAAIADRIVAITAGGAA
ncbi:MAG TPA: glycosyltransferase [Thermoanaerobaculia bacterium]|nr:glycosyltransferase [Thermoanaerobaculia bacterium]